MPSEAFVYDALRDIFADVFLRDDIDLKPSLTAQDVPGWDSYKQIEIIMAAEERFAIRLKSAEVDRLRCLGDLVSIIRERSPEPS